MLSTSYKIQGALRHAADESATVRCADGKFSLSPFLSGSFNLYRGDVLGTSILFAEDASNDDGAPKRLEALEKTVGEPVTVFLPSATTAQKRSLMAARRGFVTGQGDMYLPQLAVALRTSATKKPSSTRAFTPAQQQAFLYCLLEDGPLTQRGLREKTGMSAAGASRALSSLSEAGLIDYEVGGKTGRKRSYFVPDKAELYRRGRKLFGDPIKSVERRPASAAGSFPISGLSALAARSELVGPASRIVATGPAAGSLEDAAATAPEATCIVQRLSYDPLPFAESGVVDPFTMLMTIDEEDERISMSLREALGGYPWYTD